MTRSPSAQRSQLGWAERLQERIEQLVEIKVRYAKQLFQTSCERKNGTFD
jgi:hypothetical protein